MPSETEMRFNHCVQYVHWKAGETYMVFFWVTLDQRVVVFIHFEFHRSVKSKN